MKFSPVSSGVRIVAAALCGCAVLSGCSTFSRDGGFDTVAAAARTDLGLDVRWPRSADERAKSEAQVAALLAHPLQPDDAVQIALLENHALQASFQELGVSEADLVQSGRLPNPRFTLRHSSAGGLYDIEETLTFNVLSLIAAPYRHSIERRRFAQVQSAVIVQVVQLADRTRSAYYTALAARDSLQYAWQVKNAAQTSAELAKRMLSAGNWNQLDQARQQGFYQQALQQLAHAQLADEAAGAELRRLLGIADAGTAVNLAEHLPDLPPRVTEPPNMEASALQNRIDLKIMRADIDELARRRRLSKATRFVNVLEAGPTRVRNGTRQDPFETGYELSLDVPIFDTGGARVRKSEALYAQSVERFAQAAIDARAEIVKAAAQYRATFELALRDRDEIMPTRKLIVDQDLLRYNASLVSVFDLLADARDRIASVDDYIERVRDFWIAKSHLDTVLIANPTPQDQPAQAH
ncbi:MAG TPA: TolC family protein [Steroidobacteraceae bacterium]|nr:TolC family protein [Steroidobacteraceae bacterium]